MKQNAGFSLVEMILVVSAMIIIIAMSFPSLEGFLSFGKQQIEKQQVEEIEDALERYAVEHRGLPVANNRWAEELAEFSTLTEDEIRLDQFGNERVYVRLVQAGQVFRGGEYDIHYGVIYSYGANGCIGVVSNCDLGNPAHRFDNADVSIANFERLQAADGDYLATFNDSAIKIEAYHTTKLRLDEVSKALAEYSERRYTEALAAETAVDGYIYYPPNDLDSNAVRNSIYHPAVRADAVDVIADGFGNSIVYTGGNTTANNDRRRSSMISLMRFLGLPDEYCCNALEVYTSAVGEAVEMPFFYYSNPRLRVPGCVVARPSTVAARKSPARISSLGHTAAERNQLCG